MDAVNLIKMVLLGFFAFGSLVFLGRTSFVLDHSKLLLKFVILFSLSTIVSAWLNGSNFWLQFWGAQGRRSGILTLVSFAVLLLTVAVSTSSNLFYRIMFAIPFVGLINISYGLIQYFGADPINWRNPYSPIVGTLGNPNFMSSHLGLVSGACVVFILQLWHEDRPKKIIFSTLLILEILLSLFVIWKSLSIQGLLVFGIIVSSMLLLSLIVHLRNWLWSVFFLIFSTIIASAFFLGFYGRGPLGPALYRESFIHRTHFWDAGISMLRSNLLTGVGIDQFGDFYREYRSLSAVQLRGPAVTTDSAHNIPIDIAAGGGILPFVFYISIQILVLIFGIRMIKSLQKVDFLRIGIFSLWIGYQAQTMISINQIGVSVWGWIFGGLILALGMRKPLLNHEKIDSKPVSPLRSSNYRLAMCSLLGLVLATPPILQDKSFRDSLETQNGVRIIEASKSKPENPFYLNYASALLISNGFENQALELSKRAIKINPRNYVGWKLIMDISEVGSSDYLLAVKTLRLLDPYNDQLPTIN